MDKIKVIHDTVGHTLTVWFDEPSKERICEETTEEVVLTRDTQESSLVASHDTRVRLNL